MTWRLTFTRSAEKQLQRTRGADKTRILSVLEQISSNPYSGDIKRLRGFETKTYRRRVGNWRILYTIHEDHIEVMIEEIARRSTNTYS